MRGILNNKKAMHLKLFSHFLSTSIFLLYVREMAGKGDNILFHLLASKLLKSGKTIRIKIKTIFCPQDKLLYIATIIYCGTAMMLAFILLIASFSICDSLSFHPQQFCFVFFCWETICLFEHVAHFWAVQRSFKFFVSKFRNNFVVREKKTIFRFYVNYNF